LFLRRTKAVLVSEDHPIAPVLHQPVCQLC
jgi:hypothetical protein